jgi:hypothetical protein
MLRSIRHAVGDGDGSSGGEKNGKQDGNEQETAHGARG